MEYIVENWDNIGAIALQVIGIAALVATMTPNKTDNKIVDALSKIINLLGANFGKAKNEK
tara:strand:- start:239 stop:418 length:180 start_codon:yes stop_codon:yes gene_type:complete